MWRGSRVDELVVMERAMQRSSRAILIELREGEGCPRAQCMFLKYNT